MATEQDQQGTLPRDRHFIPWRMAATPAAQALVVEVRRQYLQHEATVSPRGKARRLTDQQVFERQIEAIVANLAYRLADITPTGHGR